jgi:hypothetical protein
MLRGNVARHCREARCASCRACHFDIKTTPAQKMAISLVEYSPKIVFIALVYDS